MATRLFVGNLPDGLLVDDLRDTFSTYGDIVNLDIKSKSAVENENKKFAFITISGSNHDIESCIRHFSSEDFKGNRLYVTRARESFLERLQRERAEAQKKNDEKKEEETEKPTKKHPVIKLGDKLNPRKRNVDSNHSNSVNNKISIHKPNKNINNTQYDHDEKREKERNDISEKDKRKHDSDQKRMESMKKKRQEFKQKQMIIKTGLTSVDKVQNKKIIFSDNEEQQHVVGNGHLKAASNSKKQKKNLFDDDANDISGDELNFDVKVQFEGKKGQKVLDLQTRYKSDKRFVLDERFIEEEQDGANNQDDTPDTETIDLEQADEKSKQLDILQNVLGVTLKRKIHDDDNKKSKPKLGMLRFDPSQPEHAKFFAPVEEKSQEPPKKKKKKDKQKRDETAVDNKELGVPKVEVSKEQFYNVSETLKEAIAQSNTFSLRSLFGGNDIVEKEPKQQDEDYIPITKTKDSKVKNPLDIGKKNPFVYDSSDSETEDVNEKPLKKTSELLPQPVVPEIKAVWKENLFFLPADQRLIDGLQFFTNPNATEAQKERRELKSLMKKRIYNKERKTQMFQKKIGGRKKTMKKSYKKKS